MNASEGFVFSNKEKDFENENGGIEPQHTLKNIHLGVSQSRRNSKVCEKSKIQLCKKYVSKRSRLSLELIHREEDLGSTSKEPTTLGLKLTITPSFIGKVNKMCLPIEKNPRLQNESLSSRHAKTKAKSDEPKASNFPAIYIKIGTWQRMARHEGELVAKFYYAKRQLVWEVLEGPLKRKMEIQWSDIFAIRAITLENELGLLEIELNQPPVYYRETCPHPRKHTLWQQSADFTGGQAPIWRRHQLTFPPGILEKNYEKLMHYDKELNALSKKPFPRHECPYFDPTLFTLEFSGYGAQQAAQYPYWACPTILQREPFSRETPNPSLSVMDLPFTHQGEGNSSFVAQNQTSWLQSFGIPRDIIFGINWTFGISSTTTSINNVYDTPLPSTTTNVNNGYNPSFPLATNDINVYDPSHCDPNTFGLLTDIQTDLFDNVRIDDALGSISSMLEPIVIVNDINDSSCQPDLDFLVITKDQVNNNYDSIGSNDMISDPNHRLAAQDPKVSSENVFQGSQPDVFQGLSENMFQGANDNMLPGANDNMFDFAGNNPKNIIF